MIAFVAILLTGAVQAQEWGEAKHSSDDMDETSQVSTTAMFTQKNINSQMGKTTYLVTLSCTKQKSGISRMSFQLNALRRDRYSPRFQAGTVIFKVDDNTPFRLKMESTTNSNVSIVYTNNVTAQLIQAFRAGTTARVRIPGGSSGSWDMTIDLSGFTRGSGPVIDYCG